MKQDKLYVTVNKTDKTIKQRLNYLRNEIENERISYLEIVELESLKQFINEEDITLLQWLNPDK